MGNYCVAEVLVLFESSPSFSLSFCHSLSNRESMDVTTHLFFYWGVCFWSPNLSRVSLVALFPIVCWALLSIGSVIVLYRRSRFQKRLSSVIHGRVNTPDWLWESCRCCFVVFFVGGRMKTWITTFGAAILQSVWIYFWRYLTFRYPNHSGLSETDWGAPSPISQLGRMKDFCGIVGRLVCCRVIRERGMMESLEEWRGIRVMFGQAPSFSGAAWFFEICCILSFFWMEGWFHIKIVI